MKILIKLLSKIILFILIIALFSNCSDKAIYEDIALLENYKVYQNGRYNLNLYLFENYNRSKSLKENLKNQSSIKCFVIIIDKEQYNNIEYFKKKIKKAYVLCNVSVELLNKKEDGVRIEQNTIEIESSKIKCDFYMLFDDFHSFKINEFLNEGIDSIQLIN